MMSWNFLDRLAGVSELAGVWFRSLLWACLFPVRLIVWCLLCLLVAVVAFLGGIFKPVIDAYISVLKNV